MSSNNFFKSDLYNVYNIIQASMLVYPKEVIITTLRDFFSKVAENLVTVNKTKST